jgi:hypothetical protein
MDRVQSRIQDMSTGGSHDKVHTNQTDNYVLSLELFTL